MYFKLEKNLGNNINFYFYEQSEKETRPVIIKEGELYLQEPIAPNSIMPITLSLNKGFCIQLAQEILNLK